MSYTTWRYATGKNSPPTYGIVGKRKIVFDIVGLTYDIVGLTYDVVRVTDKNNILACNVGRKLYIVYDIVGQDTMSYSMSYTM